MPTKFVRVKDTDTNHEYTVTEKFAAANDKLTVLKDKDAVDSNGRPLPAKTHVELPKADKASDANTGTGRQNGGESK